MLLIFCLFYLFSMIFYLIFHLMVFGEKKNQIPILKTPPQKPKTLWTELSVSIWALKYNWVSVKKFRNSFAHSVTQHYIINLIYIIHINIPVTPVSCQRIGRRAALPFLQSAMAVVSQTLMWALALSLSLWAIRSALLQRGSMFIGCCLTNCWTEGRYIAVNPRRAEAE